MDGFTGSDPEAVVVVKMGMEKEALASLSAGSGEHHMMSDGDAGGGVGYGVVHGDPEFCLLSQSDWPRELSRYASEYIPIGVVRGWDILNRAQRQQTPVRSFLELRTTAPNACAHMRAARNSMRR